jgi:RsiW-degrading membrane proteinase PrsW (M82 family)
MPLPNRWRWLRWLLIGLLLWVLSIVVMVATDNPNLIPTVIFLGSFLVPVAALIFDFDHRASAELSSETVFSAFLLGGLLGILAAGTLEAWLVQPGVWEYFQVGLIEEFAKLAALAVVARRLPRYTMRDGIVLGAAVGFGFAALESSGYAFNAMLTRQGLAIADLVTTEVMRGLLAPVGHGLWTAIAGGALFKAAGAAGHLRLTWAVVGAYLLVAFLHGLWDAMSRIAIIVTLLLTAASTSGTALSSGRRPLAVGPTPAQMQLFVILYWVGELIVALIGLAVLVGVWRAAGREPLTGRSEPPAA